jgi:glutamate-1-semialdehyde 2,1-aminomutase
MIQGGVWTFDALWEKIPAIARQWFGLTLVVVLGRVVYLAWIHNLRVSMIWFVKLVTDPITDILAYTPRYLSPLASLLPSARRHKAQ